MVKKIEQIQLKNQQNLNTVDNLQKITIKINSENFLKKVIEIPILVNQIIVAPEGGGPGG